MELFITNVVGYAVQAALVTLAGLGYLVLFGIGGKIVQHILSNEKIK